MERNPRDLYRSFDPRSGLALMQHIPRNITFAEPCAGHGDLIDQMEKAGHSCNFAMDIDPQRDDIMQGDMFDIEPMDLQRSDWIISNPPWRVDVAHPFMDHFMGMKPMAILFYADWLFTKQAAQFIPRIKTVIAIGRLKWQEGTKMDGKDNAVWLLTEPGWTAGPTLIGRAAK